MLVAHALQCVRIKRLRLPVLFVVIISILLFMLAVAQVFQSFFGVFRGAVGLWDTAWWCASFRVGVDVDHLDRRDYKPRILLEGFKLGHIEVRWCCRAPQIQLEQRREEEQQEVMPRLK